MKKWKSIALLTALVGVFAFSALSVSASPISAHFSSGSNWRSENMITFTMYYKCAWASSGTMTPNCSVTGGHYLRCTIGHIDTGRRIGGYGFKLTSAEVKTQYFIPPYVAKSYYGTAMPVS